MAEKLEDVVAKYGVATAAKLGNIGARGEPEEQIRGPFEQLLLGIAELLGFRRDSVVAVGESSISEIRTRPDYAVTVSNALVGFVELKAPGKGADPRRYRDKHDSLQWSRLKSLPNLMYTDGNSFSLWQNGLLVGEIVTLNGDVASLGSDLKAPDTIGPLFSAFLTWKPTPPHTAPQLASIAARLCRLLRDQVAEQLMMKNTALTDLAADWRRLLFPAATDPEFADGYAQAVTFGLLIARARDIPLSNGLTNVANALAGSDTLIGNALKLLAGDQAPRDALQTSLDTMIRVFDVVDWSRVSSGSEDAWLYFYEDFLEVYDPALRKLTGSYYTPAQVVETMVRLVDELLKSKEFGIAAGVAAREVTLVDPATGTGTFLLGILRRIAKTVSTDEGPGAVSSAVEGALDRVVGFEMQLGPFAVAQLRVLAEVTTLMARAPRTSPRMFVTDTLGDPFVEEGWIPAVLMPIASSRREANRLKREQTITVVIGNPPYREKAKGLGGWVEGQAKSIVNVRVTSPLADWQPPRDWRVGVHAKHLRNLYVYFWRWATWKVFDFGPGQKCGIVSYITVSGFLTGQGFEKMRDYLRRTCDNLWVINCSPEGHQPPVSTRVFEGVQHPVCVVIASRSAVCDAAVPARVRYLELPPGTREAKFEVLERITLNSPDWHDCPSEWRAPFTPKAADVWAAFPALSDMFLYDGSGVMPGRVWVIAPDATTLERRWLTLQAAPSHKKQDMFRPHVRNGQPADKHVYKLVAHPLAGFEPRATSVASDSKGCVPPVRYANRSFDRQWIIPDSRLINQPNPRLWVTRSPRQIYITASHDRSPTGGPGLTVCAEIPDIHHYHGRGGRVFPLWLDAAGTTPNIGESLCNELATRLGIEVTAGDLLAYIVAVTAHSDYTHRFQTDLKTPGLRIPITADDGLFSDAVELGRTVVWLHTFGERMADPARGRCPGSPRLPEGRRPLVSADAPIPDDADAMPASIEYDTVNSQLFIGTGRIENVPLAVWRYEVSGMPVVRQWFSARKRDRERTLIGANRKPSELNAIHANVWLPEYTSELITLLNVLAWLVELEPAQERLLDRICDGPLISREELVAAGSLGADPVIPAKSTDGINLAFRFSDD